MSDAMKLAALVTLGFMLGVLAVHLVGCAHVAPVVYQPYTDDDSYYHNDAQSYRQQRIRDQQLQHGAGGCAPNFSTGGCL